MYFNGGTRSRLGHPNDANWSRFKNTGFHNFRSCTLPEIIEAILRIFPAKKPIESQDVPLHSAPLGVSAHRAAHKWILRIYDLLFRPKS